MAHPAKGSVRLDPVGSQEGTVDTEFITLALSFEVGIEKSEKEPRSYETIRDGQRKKIYENLVRTSHFNFRYQLLPLAKEEQEPRVFKTDMVVFGDVVSKIYTDVDTRVIQGCPVVEVEEVGSEGDVGSSMRKGEEGETEKEEEIEEGEGKKEEKDAKIIKFCWKHRHKIKVTKELLLDLHHHILEIQLWFSPSKLATRARFDRPKAFRLPILSDTDLTVGELCRKPSRFPNVSHELHVRNFRGRSTKKHTVFGVPVEDSQQSLQNYSSIEIAEKISEDSMSKSLECISNRPESKANNLDCSPSGITHHGSAEESAADLPKMEGRHQSYKKLPHQLALEEAARVDRETEGASLRIPMSSIFSRHGTSWAALEESVEDVKLFKVTLSGGDTIPAHFVKELKPLTLIVEKVGRLPTTPVSHAELSKRCEPVYVQYQFPTQPPFRTVGLPHAASLTFHSQNVILLGPINKNILLEHLRGPSLPIEVHDRDIKLELESTSKSLFGLGSQDDILGTHAYSSNLARGKIYNSPFGVAKLDLRCLLSGQLSMEFTIPVVRGPRALQGFKSGKSDSTVRTKSEKVYPGDYLESGCEITVRLELRNPLVFQHAHKIPVLLDKPPKVVSPWKKTPVRKSLVPTESQLAVEACPFNRMVYVMEAGQEGENLLGRILERINEINARTLGLEGLSLSVRKAALSTYKLSQQQLTGRLCDVITGFHVEDSDQHIVMLEGLREGGIKALWEEFPHHFTQDPSLKKVFYNSECGFSERVWGTLDVDLPKIKLFQPLKEIVRLSQIYVKGYIPPQSYRALMCLNDLGVASRMTDLTRNKLFPTSEEVAALSLQFALPSLMEGGHSPEVPPQDTTKDSHSMRPMTPYLQPRTRRVWLFVDSSNPQYEELLKKRKSLKEEDYVQANKEYCRTLSLFARTIKPSGQHTHVRSRSQGDSTLPVYNYSSQAQNSTQQTMAAFKETLGSKKRYTVCQNYLSGTIEFETAALAKRFEHERGWSGRGKFVYPGVPTAKECNVHPKKPDSARLQELSEPYADKTKINRLRSSIDRRDLEFDFDLLKPPPDDLFGGFLESVHPMGDQWEEDQEEAVKREREEWKKKVVVSDIHFHTHRMGISTELGSKPAPRLDTYQGLLKDPPKKLGLKRLSFGEDYGGGLKGVISGTNTTPFNLLTVGRAGRECRVFQPGPFIDRSLRTSLNAIPVDTARQQEPNSAAVATHQHSKPFKLYYPTSQSNCHYPVPPLTSQATPILPNGHVYLRRAHRLSTMRGGGAAEDKSLQTQQTLEEAAV